MRKMEERSRLVIIQTFLAHLSNQMCYCYQKLQIWKISGADQFAAVRGPVIA